jgi:hypothetical protein
VVLHRPQDLVSVLARWRDAGHGSPPAARSLGLRPSSGSHGAPRLPHVERGWGRDALGTTRWRRWYLPRVDRGGGSYTPGVDRRVEVPGPGPVHGASDMAGSWRYASRQRHPLLSGGVDGRGECRRSHGRPRPRPWPDAVSAPRARLPADPPVRYSTIQEHVAGALGALTGFASTSNPASPDHRPARSPRMDCIRPMIERTSASSARSSLTDCGPFWRTFPLAADLALPSGVLGPVAYSQG